MTFSEITDFVLERVADIEGDILTIITAALPNKNQHQSVWSMVTRSVDSNRNRIKQTLDDNKDLFFCTETPRLPFNGKSFEFGK